ncbi:hypothetical protein B0A55_06256 [Friedmanniomyces simplex]|uniref:SWIRM domain-containing protein n=1 Tax=Friedmanniomyces simplex TaxID=329884 RepID=A0A4U0X953_9PEZI|nr:hypothetical protein B0A55_06256 [Friedmanniomyces simplex]
MAASEASVGKATLGAGHLHTPQDQIYDSFTPDGDKVEPGKKVALPISPESPVLQSFASSASHPAQDDVLFPDNTQSDNQDPLFESHSEQSESQEQDIVVPPTASPVRPQKVIEIPNPAYVRGTQILLEPSHKAALSYYKDCMAGLESTRGAQRAAGTLPFPQLSSVQPRDPVSDQQVRLLSTRPLLTRPAGVAKLKSPPKTAAVKAKTTLKAALPKAATPEKATTPARRSRTPRQRSNPNLQGATIPGDDEKKHKRAAPSKNTAPKESDLHWREMDDFAPPLSSLDGSNRLKATWGPGTVPLDVHDEPDADCLSEIEMKVAATLRLKPVQYLANKRRIFNAKVESLKANKSFTKTAAQNECNIDVNKASALWTAFDQAGWFERRWFEQYLPTAT